MKFNENLKYLRKEEKMTQEALAEKLNVSRQAVTKWESGQSLPDIENLKQMADLFGVTMDSLVGNVTTKKESRLNKKINDIGYFIFGAIVLLIGIFLSVYSFTEKITKNENVKIVTSFLVALILFVVFILMIKLYLKDTENKILNMKPTEDGKKERKNMIIKKLGLEMISLTLYGLIGEIHALPDGLVTYLIEVSKWCLGSFVLISILGIIRYLNLEKKVKQLNQD